ncbi:MAG: hypothetical protein HQM15_11125 [Deltaproteobacteria bacterium]|nr:hypothetical protein [Deltaproteobacteria bacterium]
MQEEDFTFQKLRQLKGKKVEIIAFDISYQGILESFDLEIGNLKLVDGEDSVVLELERIESLTAAQC